MRQDDLGQDPNAPTGDVNSPINAEDTDSSSTGEEEIEGLDEDDDEDEDEDEEDNDPSGAPLEGDN
jgi:hypothetical protein